MGKHKFIKLHEVKWPVELMCKFLQVSRNSYYNGGGIISGRNT